MRNQAGLDKFVDRCDHQQDFTQHIAACQKRIFRVDSVSSEAELRLLMTGGTTQVWMVRPLCAVEQFVRGLCLISNLRKCFRYRCLVSSSADISSSIINNTIDMELRVQAHNFTAAYIDRETAANPASQHSSVYTHSLVPLSYKLPTVGVREQHGEYEDHQGLANDFDDGRAKSAFTACVWRLPSFTRLMAIISGDLRKAIGSDLSDAPHIISSLTGRFHKYSTYKRHILSIPRALLVSQGELYLLFNCALNGRAWWKLRAVTVAL